MVRDAAPTALSLFSGAGGMDRGLEAAGFEHVGVVELDPLASKTLAYNRPSWTNLAGGDVLTAARELTPRSLGFDTGDLDLIAGGPPCQPFSLAAQWASSGRRGMSDPRAATVNATMDLIRTFLPKFVLMENVLGFTRGRYSAMDLLKAEFDNIELESGCQYRLEWRLINAAHYGVPQNRNRVILVASRAELQFSWPAATHVNQPVTSWDAISDVEQATPEPPSGRWADLLPSIPAGMNYQWLTSRGGGEELFGYRTKYWNFLLKLAPNLPSWTIAASPGPATGPFHWENRPLSTRERLRLQSFPDDWHLCGNTRQQTKQAGNATPPLLAEIWGRALADALGYETTLEPQLLVSRSMSSPPALPDPSPVPAKYHHLTGPKIPHAGIGRGPSPRGFDVGE